MATAEGLRLQSREHRGAIVVQPVGVLDRANYSQLRDFLIKCAVDGPAAVVVDVDRLRLPSVHALNVFVNVWTNVAQWPGVPLVLVAGEPERRAALASSAASRFVPVHPDLETAMRSVGRPPSRRRDRLVLPGLAASSALSRRHVRRLCQRWGIASSAEDAATVVTELVENVIQHTTSEARLQVELRDDQLSVAVSDSDPHPAVIREAVSNSAPSAGLAIVARLTRTWGCTSTASGKVVWAVLRTG